MHSFDAFVRRVRFAALACLPLALIAGCGDSGKLKVHPVQGRLLLDDEPFGPTQISLVPVNKEEGRSVAGDVAADGTITFTSYQRGDGAPAGSYRVVVGLVMAPPPKPFPELYRDFEKSPLQVTIEPGGTNELTIAMDSTAGPPARVSSMHEMMMEPMQSEGFSAGAAPPPGRNAND